MHNRVKYMYLIHPRLLLGCVSGVCYSVNLRQSRACHFTYLREVRVEEAERSGTVTSKGNRVERCQLTNRDDEVGPFGPLPAIDRPTDQPIGM